MNDKSVLSCRNLSKATTRAAIGAGAVRRRVEPAAWGAGGYRRQLRFGQSTLLNMLGGLDTPSAGSVWLAGENSRR